VGAPKKPLGFFWVCTQVSEPCQNWYQSIKVAH